MNGPERPTLAGGYEIALPGGAFHTLLSGASLGLVGGPAADILVRFAAEHAAVRLVPDRADPLHAGFAVADQIAAALGGTRRAALDRATDLLELTGVPEPHHRARARPHQLSRLDRQRVQLALALANDPGLIAAEDPMAGMDQTEAAAFATLLWRLRARHGFALLTATSQPEAAERMVDEIIVLDDTGVRQRRRRRWAQPASSASSSST
jgi:ABC-type dipeptide/oligopeptide/nickel transport system ATPase component